MIDLKSHVLKLAITPLSSAAITAGYRSIHWYASAEIGYPNNFAVVNICLHFRNMMRFPSSSPPTNDCYEPS